MDRQTLNAGEATWINVFEGPRFLKHSGDFLWLSERDGWLHANRHRPKDR